MLLIEKRVEEAIELSNVAHTLKPSEYDEKVHNLNSLFQKYIIHQSCLCMINVMKRI